MRFRSLSAKALAVAVAPMAAAILAGPAAAAEAPTVAVQGSTVAAAHAQRLSATPSSAAVEFEVGLELPQASAAVAFEKSVSSPASADYRHYLTPAQWEKRFSPSQASVRAVRSWLESEGIDVEGVTPDRMMIEASAPAATVERAFGTSLGEYRRSGHQLRLASSALKVPSSIAGLISGISGINQTYARPDALTGAETRAAARPNKQGPIPAPLGFRNPQPCSGYWGEKLDTTDTPYGDGFPESPPYSPCGYTPPQLQGAYGLTPELAKGIDGSGVTVAIVDAYAASTLYQDAREYSERNQPGQVLEPTQFTELLPKKFNEEETCEAEEWSGEQTLDIEAVHATAPGAHILFVGAKNCLGGLYQSVQQVVDGHLASIITDSWGDDGGDVIDAEGERRAFDNILLMAGGTGIGVQFSAGDEGDEFINFGESVGGYPETSPYQTSVGGTTLEINANNERIGEYGWSTSKSVLCTPLLELEEYPGCTKHKLSKWLPKAPGGYDYGGGGATSYSYPEPWYQEGVVPSALALRNKKTTHIANRVEPDISMLADPSTGMLVGETQEFPDGTYYDQYRIGGTSLASPLFAGVMADADQAAGVSLGFANPLLYRLEGSSSTPAGTFYDVVPGGPQDLVRVDYLDGVDEAEGLLTQVRVTEYEGREQYCETEGPEGEEVEGACKKQKVSLSTAPGFDSMTGIGTPGPNLISALSTP